MSRTTLSSGNRQQRIFFTQGDCRRYVEMLAECCAANAVRCYACCLMPNHVHLVLNPATVEGLRKVMSSVHTRYAQRINKREGLTGHLFQGRFRSYAMSDEHLFVAVRYVENNPVKAGLAIHAEDWLWSSARAHLELARDPLTDIAALAPHLSNWRVYLCEGAEAEREEALEAALRSGRPLGNISGTSGIPESGGSGDSPS